MKAEKCFNEVGYCTTAKGRRTLQDVKMVCDLLEKEGLRINVSLIGRELHRQGIKVLEQSIRNNKKLMKYVRLRVKEQVIETREFVGDLGLIEQIRALKHENMVLRQFIKKNAIKIIKNT